MEVVQLDEGESYEGEHDERRLVAVELVLVIDDCAHEELDRDLGHEERVRREDPADGAEGQAAEEAHAGGGIARERGGCGGYGYYEGGLADHPQDEGWAVEKGKELVEVMRWLWDGPEDCDKQGSGADEQGATVRPARERLAEDQRGADGVEDEAGGLQR